MPVQLSTTACAGRSLFSGHDAAWPLTQLMWLLQEKAQLKAQQQQVEAAREARRGKMHITIDLLGRQVRNVRDAP